MAQAGYKGARPLAIAVGLSASFVSLVVKGKRRLGPESASQIAKALGVDTLWLLTAEGPAPSGYSETPELHPRRSQAIDLLQGLIAPQVAQALRREVPDGDWTLEQWLARAKVLQKLYEQAKVDLEDE
jgi:transcriptional regulator with XRE-family HTH domain